MICFVDQGWRWQRRPIECYEWLKRQGFLFYTCHAKFNSIMHQIVGKIMICRALLPTVYSKRLKFIPLYSLANHKTEVTKVPFLSSRRVKLTLHTIHSTPLSRPEPVMMRLCPVEIWRLCLVTKTFPWSVIWWLKFAIKNAFVWKIVTLGRCSSSVD